MNDNETSHQNLILINSKTFNFVTLRNFEDKDFWSPIFEGNKKLLQKSVFLWLHFIKYFDNEQFTSLDINVSRDFNVFTIKESISSGAVEL